MNESVHAEKPVEPLRQRDLHHDQVLGHVPMSAADAARSAKNIANWNTYLPAACVRAMVRMGWDYTT
jgi:hypothetical protein